MPRQNTDQRSSQLMWRYPALLAVLCTLPLLGACGKSGSDSTADKAAAPAQQESTAGSGMMMGGEHEKMMDQGAGSSMAATSGASSAASQASEAASQAADTATQAVQTAAATATQAATAATEAAKEEAKRAPMDGYEVYTRFCVICHKSGMNGAPKYGDKLAWKPRIAQGKDTMYDAAINGLRAMPPKGGIAGLYDQEVKDAVDYMVNAAGGWK